MFMQKQYFADKPLAAAEVSDFKALPGNGLTAVLDGRRLYGGNARFIGGEAWDAECASDAFAAIRKTGRRREKHRYFLPKSIH